MPPKDTQAVSENIETQRLEGAILSPEAANEQAFYNEVFGGELPPTNWTEAKEGMLGNWMEIANNASLPETQGQILTIVQGLQAEYQGITTGDLEIAEADLTNFTEAIEQIEAIALADGQAKLEELSQSFDADAEKERIQAELIPEKQEFINGLVQRLPSSLPSNLNNRIQKEIQLSFKNIEQEFLTDIDRTENLIKSAKGSTDIATIYNAIESVESLPTSTSNLLARCINNDPHYPKTSATINRQVEYIQAVNAYYETEHSLSEKFNLTEIPAEYKNTREAISKWERIFRKKKAFGRKGLPPKESIIAIYQSAETELKQAYALDSQGAEFPEKISNKEYLNQKLRKPAKAIYGVEDGKLTTEGARGSLSQDEFYMSISGDSPSPDYIRAQLQVEGMGLPEHVRVSWETQEKKELILQGDYMRRGVKIIIKYNANTGQSLLQDESGHRTKLKEKPSLEDLDAFAAKYPAPRPKTEEHQPEFRPNLRTDYRPDAGYKVEIPKVSRSGGDKELSKSGYRGLAVAMKTGEMYRYGRALTKLAAINSKVPQDIEAIVICLKALEGPKGVDELRHWVTGIERRQLRKILPQIMSAYGELNKDSFDLFAFINKDELGNEDVLMAMSREGNLSPEMLQGMLENNENPQVARQYLNNYFQSGAAYESTNIRAISKLQDSETKGLPMEVTEFVADNHRKIDGPKVKTILKDFMKRVKVDPEKTEDLSSKRKAEADLWAKSYEILNGEEISREKPSDEQLQAWTQYQASLGVDDILKMNVEPLIGNPYAAEYISNWLNTFNYTKTEAGEVNSQYNLRDEATLKKANDILAIIATSGNPRTIILEQNLVRAINESSDDPQDILTKASRAEELYKIAIGEQAIDDPEDKIVAIQAFMHDGVFYGKNPTVNSLEDFQEELNGRLADAYYESAIKKLASFDLNSKELNRINQSMYYMKPENLQAILAEPRLSGRSKNEIQRAMDIQNKATTAPANT
jgi:hypothetical protein